MVAKNVSLQSTTYGWYHSDPLFCRIGGDGGIKVLFGGSEKTLSYTGQCVADCKTDDSLQLQQ